MPRKLELIVCAACVTAMVMKVAVIGTVSGKQAREAVCVMKLQVWGTALAVNISDNDECFMRDRMKDNNA